MTTETTHEPLIGVMRDVAGDCESDAMALDGKPLSGLTVGQNFGGTYAMLQATARAVATLAEDFDRQLSELRELLTELRDDHHELALTFRRHQAKAVLRATDDGELHRLDPATLKAIAPELEAS